MMVAQFHADGETIDSGTPVRDRDLTDARLVYLIQQRDVGALELVYQHHAGAALGLARRMVADPALAEDVTQEAFVSVWRSAHLYVPERGSVRNWVLGITRHRAIDALRRRTAQACLKATEASLVPRLPGRDVTEAEALHGADERMVQTALRTLPGEQRRALELAYFAGLTHSEIAAKLQLPLGTVKGRIRLGLEKLLDVLGPVRAEG